METTNIGFYSTLVEEGSGEAVVIATGENTILGKMSQLTRTSSGDEITGLHREVNRFVLFVVMATLTGITILWITWGAWLNLAHPTFVTMNGNIVNSIGMIVGFLPMGLPSAVTLGESSHQTSSNSNAKYRWVTSIILCYHGPEFSCTELIRELLVFISGPSITLDTYVV